MQSRGGSKVTSFSDDINDSRCKQHKHVSHPNRGAREIGIFFFDEVEKLYFTYKLLQTFTSVSYFDKMSMDLDAPVYMQQQEQTAAT